MSGDTEISLRRAIDEIDARQLFEWRNDPFIWSRGSSQRTVSWVEHKAWFDASLANADRLVYIVERGSTPAGMVRFDRENAGICVISVYLAKAFVGRGWGVRAIRLGVLAVVAAWGSIAVNAAIRRDNPGGKAAFLKAGFQPGPPADKEHDVLTWSPDRSVIYRDRP